MKFNTITALLLSLTLGSSLSSCNKQVAFEQTDRLSIAKNFNLKEVRNNQGELLEQYSYNKDQQLKEALLFGGDRFTFRYNSTANKPIAFNDYQCSYDAQGRLTLVEGPELSTARIQYDHHKIEVIQTTRTIVPGPRPTLSDTLTFLLDDKGTVINATLLPKKIAFEFRYDHNKSPYFRLNEALFPVLLAYPVSEFYGQLAGFISNKNVQRIYQNGINVSTSVEKPLVEDFSYRYDHFKYDVPTSSNSYTGQGSERRYIYSE